MVLFGSGMGNANAHTNINLPIILAGGGFKHGEHRAFPQIRTWAARRYAISSSACCSASAWRPRSSRSAPALFVAWTWPDMRRWWGGPPGLRGSPWTRFWPVFALALAVSAADSTAFLATYCNACHGPTAQMADRRFDQLRLPPADADTLILLQDILDKMNTGTMPPRAAKQPPAAESRGSSSRSPARLPIRTLRGPAQAARPCCAG